MSARTNLIIGVVLIALVAMGCNQPTERLNAPPQGPSQHPHQLQGPMAHEVDNALMYDLSVADIHFVPHTTQLSGLGVRRLNRYAELLAPYGGTIHLETTETDETLIADRIETVTTFLAKAGLDMAQVEVKPGLTQGRGVPGEDALLILDQGTVDETTGYSGSSQSRSAQ
jgi:hypothetical protein